MDFFPIPLFPAEGLGGSVITCVWVGVFVVSFFNLRFGWVLTGLVVPGYLVPLLLLKPWSVLAIVIEASVTYLLVWLFSERLSRFGGWSSLFGRDRFFALIVSSIAVRLLFDGLIFPAVGEQLNRYYGLSFDYVNNLHSFGLIIVALIANLFWKPGYGRGMFTLVVTVGLSFLIIRYGMMEFTNFSMGNIQYVYEDLASSILAGPKAYIILICTALIASRMNLHYGWEYNGILIPSLLALQWYEPSKILITFVEAFIILGLAHYLLRIPWLAHAHIEGARKVLLFFNISFAYKWVSSLLLVTFLPAIKVTDAFAFGYLLSSLMAIKMHDKAIIGILTRATLQTSLTAVLLASLIGYGLSWLPAPQLFFSPASPVAAVPATTMDDEPLLSLLRKQKVVIYKRLQKSAIKRPTLIELQGFEAGIKLLNRFRSSANEEFLSEAKQVLDHVGYGVQRVQGRYLLLTENKDAQGRGIYVIDLKSEGTMLLEVPAPADERGSLDSGAWLFTRFNGQALAIGGTYSGSSMNDVSNVLHARQSFFYIFHKHMSHGNVLQVRAYSEDNIAQLFGSDTTAGIRSSLWVKNKLPEAINLRQLQQMTGDFDVLWRTTPMTNRLRDLEYGGVAELFLNQEDQRSLLASTFSEDETLLTEEHLQRIDGYLQDWLLSGKERFAQRGSNDYQPPEPEQLLYLDEEVLSPLIRLIYAPPSAQMEARLNAISAAASVLDYRLIRYRHMRSGDEFLILEENVESPKRRYWGTVVFRLGTAENYMIQVPRPLYERNSFEFGVFMFERLKARALVYAGANPLANAGGEADTSRVENVANVFNLVTQVILRDMPANQPALVIHSRAFGLREQGRQSQADALLAFSDGITQESQLPALGQGLTVFLDQSQLAYELVNGSEATAGYEVTGLPQSLYMEPIADKFFSILWLSPVSRRSYQQQTNNMTQENQFRALAINTIEAYLPEYLHGSRHASGGISPALAKLLSTYLATQDIVSLRKIQQDWPNYKLQRLIDLDSRQAYLLIADQRGVFIVINLNPRNTELHVKAGHRDDVLNRFINSGAAWLEFEDAP